MSATDKRSRKYQSNHIKCCCWFWREGRIEVPREKPLKAKQGTNKLISNMVSRSESSPGLIGGRQMLMLLCQPCCDEPDKRRCGDFGIKIWVIMLKIGSQ